MQMQDLAAAGSLVQVVDVLGDDVYAVASLQLGQREMRGIGLHLLQLATAGVVEIEDEPGIGVKAFGRSHIFHTVAFPQAARVAEGFQTAVGADAGSGQDHAGFHEAVP